MQKRMWYVTNTCMRRVFPEFHHKSIKHLWNEKYGIDATWWEDDGNMMRPKSPDVPSLHSWPSEIAWWVWEAVASPPAGTILPSLAPVRPQPCKAAEISWESMCHDVSHDVIMMSGGMSMAWSKHLRILDWWILGWVCVGSCSVGHAKQDSRRNIFRASKSTMIL